MKAALLLATFLGAAIARPVDVSNAEKRNVACLPTPSRDVFNRFGLTPPGEIQGSALDKLQTLVNSTYTVLSTIRAKTILGELIAPFPPQDVWPPHIIANITLTAPQLKNLLAVVQSHIQSIVEIAGNYSQYPGVNNTLVTVLNETDDLIQALKNTAVFLEDGTAGTAALDAAGVGSVVDLLKPVIPVIAGVLRPVVSSVTGIARLLG